MVAVIALAIALGSLRWYATGGSGPSSPTPGIVPAGAPLSRQIVKPACNGMPASDGTIACIEQLDHALDRGEKPPLPLVLFRPLTGEMQILRRPDDDEQFSSAAISADGNNVAYTVGRGEQQMEVRLISTAGGAERSLTQLPQEASMLALLAWSARDGQIDVRIWGKDNSHSLGVLSPETGAIETVFRFPGVPQTFARSPDGQLVAFDARQSESDPERDIRVCQLPSGDCATIAAHPANDVSPIWAPDGRLFFVSDRSGVMGIWSVDLDGLNSRHPPDLVRDTGRSRPGPIGFTADGAFFYNLSVDEFDIYSADLQSAEAMAPVRISPRAVDINKAPEWSPDGRQLAYVSRRGPFSESGATRIVLQDVADQTEREFRMDVRPNMTRLAWSPDGQMLAMRTLLGRDPASWMFGIHLISVADGHVVKTLRRHQPPEKYVEDQIGDLVWVDRNTILFSSHGGIRRFDVESGDEQAVWSPTAGQVVEGLVLSPDGTRMAAGTVEDLENPQRAILRTIVIPSGGGPTHEVLRDTAPQGSTVWAWTADGRSLLVTRWVSATIHERRVALWLMPVDGGEPLALPLSNPQIVDVSAHPDGRRIAFVMGAPHTQFWVMTGFDHK